MSIEIDWELTDAPTGEEPSQPPARTPPPPGPPPAGGPPGDELPAPAPRSRRWWLALPLALLIVAVVSFAFITRQGWQRITDEVSALVRYEEQLSYQGETLLVLRLQDYADRQWIAVRTNQVAARQPAPLPVPVLAANPDPAAAQVGPLQMVDTDWVRAEVVRQYRTPDGNTVTFALPQFYRRPAQGGDWVRTTIPDSYWGGWQDWQSNHLYVRHSERDGELVKRIGPRLETLLARACSLWGERCAGLPPAKLFLSGYVGSLEYDPLANVRVRVEFGRAVGAQSLPADYFISVPSPQLAGAPVDAITEEYLTEYLAVRLIAFQASAAAISSREADTLTAQAIARLNLDSADPGFAAATTPPRGDSDVMFSFVAAPDEAIPAAAEPFATVRAPSPGVTLITQLQPQATLVTYEVQAGDSLWAIAASHGVSVDSLARLNGLADPDLIQPGTTLLIPIEPSP